MKIFHVQWRCSSYFIFALHISCCVHLVAHSATAQLAPPPSPPTAKQTDTGEAIAELRMTKIALQQSKVGESLQALLPIEIKSKSQCFFSDLDAIAVDSLYLPHPRFILTLEPSNPGAAAPALAYAEIEHPGDIAKGGVKLSLTFPFPKTTELLSIFICGDSEGKNRCNDGSKELVDFRKLFSKNTLPTLDAYVAKDVIYFSKPLLLSPTTAEFPTRPMTAGRYSAFEKLAKSSVTTPINPGELSSIIMFGTKLGSVPLRETVGNLRIDLPRYEKDRCVW